MSVSSQIKTRTIPIQTTTVPSFCRTDGMRVISEPRGLQTQSSSPLSTSPAGRSGPQHPSPLGFPFPSRQLIMKTGRPGSSGLSTQRPSSLKEELGTAQRSQGPELPPWGLSSLCCVLSPRALQSLLMSEPASGLHQREAAWPVVLTVGGAAFSVEQKHGAHSRPHTVTSLGAGGLLCKKSSFWGERCHSV